MTYTLAWKEFREQQAIWLAVIVMAVLILAGLKASLQPSELATLDGLGLPGGVVVLLSLAGVYGLACGASLFAGEVENRTLAYLDSLPTTRADLWWTKAISGLALSASQGLLLALVGCVASLEIPQPEHLFWVLPLTTTEAFAWGLVGSAVTRSALPAAALGAVPLSLSWLLGGVMFWPPPLLGVLPRMGLLLLALLLSRRLFCEPDRTRTPLASTALRRTPRQATADGAPTPLRSLLWLIVRQGWGEALVLGVLAFVEGLFLPKGGLTLWLFVTLSAGVLCGTGTFRDEQAGDSARFLGEQRLPPGLFWIVKLGCWLTLAVGLTVLMFVVGVLAAGTNGVSASSAFGQNLLLRPESALVLLVVGLFYGFAVGQLAALVVRKPPASVVLAVLLAGPAVAVWVPSAILGGLPVWQPLTPIAILLAAGFLVRREWAADRMTSRRAVLTLVVAVVLSVGVIGGALAWRVVEVPDGQPPFDVAAFEKTLPSPEQNTAGRLIRQATQRLRERLQAMEPQFPQGAAMGGAGGAPGAVAMPPGGEAMLPRDFSEEAAAVAAHGWKRGSPELARWLDQLFADDWVKLVLELPEQPLGVLENPELLRLSSLIPTTQECGPMARYCTARALQLQAAGKNREALELLDAVLALSRNLRNKAVPVSYLIGLSIERSALIGLQHWLDGVGRQRELLQSAATILARHEAELPPLSDSLKTEYLIFRNSVLNPQELGRLAAPAHRGEGFSLANWVTLVSPTPWERLRLERLLNAAFTLRMQTATPTASEDERRLEHLLASSLLHRAVPPRSDQLQIADSMGLAWVHGTRLMTALTLYQIGNNKPAGELAELVPKYLPEVPTDPFNGGPFRYRLSSGERLVWHTDDVAAEQELRTVPLNQGIIWSVGPDSQDDGGQRQGADQRLLPRYWSSQKLDLIFLAPIVPER